MSFIRRFIDRIYGKSDQYTVTFAGLDAAGKTTLLYLLKLNEVINTIPTLGFNVETFKPPTLAKDGTVTTAAHEICGWDAGTGCAGPRYMVNLLQWYIDRADALVWVVDSWDRERLQESTEALAEVLRVYGQRQDHIQKSEKNLSAESIAMKPKRIPILVLANKQELPDKMSVDEIRRAFASVLSGTICAVYPTTSMAGLSAESGIPQAFDWLNLAIEISREQLKNIAVQQEAIGGSPLTGGGAGEKELSHQLSVRTPGNLAPKLDSWLSRLEEEKLAPEEFLQKFEEVALPDWDHYTHIRLAYHVLTIHGRQKGKDMLFDGIAKYISQSKGLQTTGKSFHFTMTYFWTQIVHFSIQNMSQEFTPNADENQPRAWVDDFARFLVVNPFVVDGSLWMDYYSKEVIMTPIAKKQMVLPDKKHLPSVVTRDSVAKLVPNLPL